MPVISRFYGIIIKMYFRQKEHNPPHIHAVFGEQIGIFLILNGEMIEGDMSSKNQKLVQNFVNYYQDELMEIWETQEFKVLPPII